MGEIDGYLRLGIIRITKIGQCMWRIMDLVAGITLICQNQLNNPRQHSNQSLLRSKGAIDDWNILNIGSEILKGTGSSCKEKICWKDMRPTQLPISSLVPISQIYSTFCQYFAPLPRPNKSYQYQLWHITYVISFGVQLNPSPNFVKSFKHIFNCKKICFLFFSLLLS